MSEEKSLISILEETSIERKRGRANETDVHYANKLITSCEDGEELKECLNDVQIHGSFKPLLLEQLKKVNPNFFKTN